MYKPKKQTIRVNVKKNWTDTNVVAEQERNFDSGYPVTTRPLRVYGEEVIDGKRYKVVSI